jgi:hypothetical protein
MGLLERFLVLKLDLRTHIFRLIDQHDHFHIAIGPLTGMDCIKGSCKSRFIEARDGHDHAQIAGNLFPLKKFNRMRVPLKI